MRSARALVVLALTVLVVAGCAGPGGSAAAAELVRSDAPRAAADAAAGLAVAAAVEAFSADLYGFLAREPGNVVFSPYSVAVALAMTRAGAKGTTADQMDKVLHAATARDLDAGFNALEQELAKRPGKYPFGDGTVDLELATANDLWAQRGFPFEAPFLDRLAVDYGAGMRLVDFVQKREEARRAINDRVSERTHKRIPELIPQGVLNDLTRLVLTNAVYLKAKWVFSFAKGATAPAPFYRADGSETRAQLMQLNARLRYGRGAGYEAVALPYVGGLSMVVIVPEKGGLAAFEKSLREGPRLREAIGGLRDAQVRLRLPKFEFRKQAMLKGPLSDLGMPIAFEPGKADFSGVSP